MIIDKNFIIDFLLSKSGRLNARALEKYQLTKEHAFKIFHNLTDGMRCENCESPTKFISFNKGYSRFCSVMCAANSKDVQEKKRKTLLKNYGTDAPWSLPEIQNKKKNTSIINYGVEHPSKSKEFQEIKKTMCLEKYGVESVAQLEEVKDKKRKTCLKRYGVDNPAKSPEFLSKIKKTNFEKYGVTTVLMLDKNRQSSLKIRRDQEVYKLLNNKDWLIVNKEVPSTLLSDQLGVAFSTILNYYKLHEIQRPNVIISKYEYEILDFLKNLGIEFIPNDRNILDGKEIDIYLPQHKIGIELDGIYWHSEKYLKDKFYHSDKTRLAREKGIQLLHILDIEWNTKKEIVKNRLLAKLGKSNRIYARNCKVVELDNYVYRDFINRHHIQGYAPAMVRLGLKYDDELVSVMSFSSSRYNKSYQWELIRYASIGAITGGASKLFLYFIKNYDPLSIISYADLRWNTGKLYSIMGMEYIKTTKPNYWYHNGTIFKHRSSYQKHKLKKELKIFDPELTEWENMKLNGFDRYWDCGNNVYGWFKT